MMSDFNDYYWFALVVEHNGFSATERATGFPKSTLSRRIQHLEETLGVRLIQRTSRQFAVTDIGMNVYRHAQAMRMEMQAAQDAVNHLSATPRGIIRVSVPVSIAQQELAQVLPNFVKTYPDIQIQLMVTNRRIDIINEGIDVALRVRSQLDQDSSLIIRRFGQIRQLLVASKTYIKQHGEPKNLQQLSQHATLSMNEDEAHQYWELTDKSNDIQRIKINPKVMASNLSMLLQLTVQGAGVALLPESICAEQVRNGQLEVILPAWDIPQGTFHAIYPSRRGLLPAIRTFIDYLVAELPAQIEKNRL